MSPLVRHIEKGQRDLVGHRITWNVSFNMVVQAFDPYTGSAVVLISLIS